jgi:hypothetical protein
MRDVSTGNTAMVLPATVLGVPVRVAPELDVDLLVKPELPAVRDSYWGLGSIIISLTPLAPKAGSARDDR